MVRWLTRRKKKKNTFEYIFFISFKSNNNPHKLYLHIIIYFKLYFSITRREIFNQIFLWSVISYIEKNYQIFSSSLAIFSQNYRTFELFCKIPIKNKYSFLINLYGQRVESILHLVYTIFNEANDNLSVANEIILAIYTSVPPNIQK